MQAADLNLALEQINGLYGQGLRLIELSERLSGGLTMELALEADRVLPSLKASDLYFSAAKAQNQLALEGIVDSVIEGLRKLFKKIVDTIKRFLSWISGQGWTTREERRDKFAQQLAREAAKHRSENNRLANGEYDSVITDAYLKKPGEYPVLKALLYDHPVRSAMILDSKSKYQQAVDQALKYLEDISPRIETTGKIMNEIHDHVRQMNVAKIPEVLAALQTLWGPLDGQKDVAKEVGAAMYDAAEDSPHNDSSVKTSVRYSHLYKLHEEANRVERAQKRDRLIIKVAHPLELLNARFEMFDQALAKMKKAGDSMAQVPGVQRADGGNPEDFHKATKALHEVAMLVFRVTASEIKLVELLNRHADAEVQMSRSWLLGYIEVLRITESEDTLKGMDQSMGRGPKPDAKK